MKLAIIALTLLSSQAHAIEECHGANRAARHLTCIYDADTGWENGVKWRLLDIDAPELGNAACPRERHMGVKAKKRLIALMNRGYRIEYSGEKDRTNDRRELVRVVLSDGRDAGKVLMIEKFAQKWPNRGNVWCE